MTDEEKKAIDYLKNKNIYFDEYEACEDYETEYNIKTILNLIEKQQAEIEELTLKNTERIINKVEVEVLDEFREENNKLKAEIERLKKEVGINNE